MSSNASLSTPYNIPAPGSASNYGQGGGYIVTGARDIADAKRMMAAGYVPTAEYPDGYLGTVNSRREDRLFNGVKRRVSDRSYSRGVHKGEHIDPADYYWTQQVNPTIALEYEARGQKWTQQQSFIGSKLVDDGKNLSPVTTPQRFATAQMTLGQAMEPPFLASDDEQRRKQQMRRYLPRWD
jgi:hypothetical protein